MKENYKFRSKYMHADFIIGTVALLCSWTLVVLWEKFVDGQSKSMYSCCYGSYAISQNEL